MPKSSKVFLYIGRLLLALLETNRTFLPTVWMSFDQHKHELASRIHIRTTSSPFDLRYEMTSLTPGMIFGPDQITPSQSKRKVSNLSTSEA